MRRSRSFAVACVALVAALACCTSLDGLSGNDAACDASCAADSSAGLDGAGEPDVQGRTADDAAIDHGPLFPHRYVIDHEQLPTTNDEARASGLDLDGDHVVDNELGVVFAVLSGQGFGSQSSVDSAIDTGFVLMLAQANLSSLDGGGGDFTLYTGANPSPAPCGDAGPTCRRHLQGDASFTVAPTSARDAPLPSTITAGELTGGPGELHLQMGFLGQRLTFDLVGARVELSGVTEDGIASGILAGGLTKSEVDDQMLPAMQAAYAVAIGRDCSSPTNPPTCGCADGSVGQIAIGIFDSDPQDCAVSLDEVENNGLLQNLLAPDITIDGVNVLSVGIKVTAVKAAFAD